MLNWIIHTALLSVIAYLASRLIKSEIPQWIYWAGLFMKLSAGLILGLIFYEYYGVGDTITFYENAKNLTPYSDEPRTQFFLFILKPVVGITGSYWITSLYFSLTSYLCFWYAANVLSQLYQSLKWIIAISFLLIPSIVFWSSGIIKDSISSAALMLLVCSAIHVYRHSKLRTKDIVLILLSAFILLKIKHYLLITSLLFVGILFSLHFFRKLGIAWKIGSVAVIILAITLTQFIHPYLKLETIPWTLQQNNQAILKKSAPDSKLNIELREASWVEVIQNAPASFHAGLFRPSIMDPTPAWGWIHRIENLILTTLIMLTLLVMIKEKPIIDRPMIIAGIACIFLLATILPLSTPNFGTLVRYKNAYMPFIFLLSSILPYRYLSSPADE